MLRALLLALGLCATALSSAGHAALPIPDHDASVLRIQGSNTINARLGPALAQGLMQRQGLRDIEILPGRAANEMQVTGTGPAGQRITIEVAAHGSGTGFHALNAGQADIAASSRPINDREATQLAKFGDLRSAAGEQVIAIDGVAVIVHPGNPLRELTIEHLGDIFSGKIRDWQELGGTPGSIHLYARDEQSGTWETFKELVMSRSAVKLAAGARRFESSEQLSDEVARDPNGIGFIGLPYVRNAKALAVADGASKAMRPTVELIATEDYPLSRRLYLYLPPLVEQPWARALARFAQSSAGQTIVADSGFVAQTIDALKVQPMARMPGEYRVLIRDAQRLSVNFRFSQGSATLDNKALRDIKRVVDYLKANDKADRKVTLVGFGDAKSDPDRAALLSRLRAMAVRRELQKSGVTLHDVMGLGDEMPVAANDIDDGRIKNRRVEVWVR
ncbi:phosphate ABC transporter substrate-binding/OmpA family protein [Pseudomonas sp. JDS28PS106]|uniref:phosphate ABC transporter substrate-binding/OmpA family protein n=1 Tax=Pseudomonas sp. JDS28PS106 TaxID=2497235 RepID=UPI002FD2B871